MNSLVTTLPGLVPIFVSAGGVNALAGVLSAGERFRSSKRLASVLFMIISHVKIIAFQAIPNHSFWTFYIGGKPVVYIINREIHGCLEILDLFLVLNMMIFHDNHVQHSK